MDWEQKESYLPDAPEVYYDEPSLQLVSGNHRAGYANNVLEVDQQEHPKTGSTKHQRLWLSSAVVAILVCLAIGLGVGLHFRSSATNSTSTNATSQQSTGAATSPNPMNNSSSSNSSISTTISTTSTTTPVTSGSTGIAANDCTTRDNNEYTTNNNPTVFIFDCEADYPHAEPAYSGNGTVIDLMALITYTFEECMENCAVYNAQTSTTTACLAITYAANLTSSIPRHADANCWLKNVRGKQTYGNAIDLTSSAYASLG